MICCNLAFTLDVHFDFTRALMVFNNLRLNYGRRVVFQFENKQYDMIVICAK